MRAEAQGKGFFVPYHSDVTLAILAGGRATRMGGYPKGLLLVEGRTIIERLLDLKPSFAEALVVANDPAPYERFGIRITSDLVRDRGAPGGLHAALRAAHTEWVLLVACDMPYVSAELAEALLAARTPALDWLMFEREGRPEPLFGLYRTRLAGAVEAALAHEPSMRKAVEAGRGALIPAPSSRALQNLNTLEDAARAGALSPPRDPVP